LLWLGVIAAVLILTRYYQAKLPADRTVAAFVVIAFSFDFVRVLGTRQIFKHARRWSEEDNDKSLLGGRPILGGAAMLTTGGLVIAALIFDTMLLILAWGALLLGPDNVGQSALLLCLFHAAAYETARMDEWWRRRG